MANSMRFDFENNIEEIVSELQNLGSGMDILIGKVKEVQKPVETMNKSFTKTMSLWLNLMFLGQNLNKMFGGLRDLIWQTYLNAAFLSLSFDMMAELQPLLDPIIDAVWDLLDLFYDLPGPMKFIIAAFVLLIGVIVSVIPLVTNLVLMNWALAASGTTATGALLGIVGSIHAIGLAVKAALPWLFLLTAAILILSWAWEADFLGIATAVEEASYNLQDKFDSLGMAIEGLLTQDWEEFNAGLEGLIEGTPLEDAKNAWDELNATFDSINKQDYAGAKEHLNSFKDSMIEALVPDFLEEPVKNFVDNTLIPLYMDIFVPIGVEATKALGEFKTNFVDPFIAKGKEIYDGFTKWLGDTWIWFDTEFLKPIEKGWNDLTTSISEVIQSWKNFFWVNFIEPVKTKFNEWKTWLEDNIFTPLKNFVMDNIVTPLKNAWDGLGKKVGEIWDGIKAKVLEVYNAVKPFIDFIKGGIDKAKESVGIGGQTGGGFLTGLGEWIEGFKAPGFTDFIMRPGQAPVSFSDSDTLIGARDLSSLRGSSNNYGQNQASFVSNITINVSSASRSDIETLKRELNQSMEADFRRLTSGW